MTSAVYCSYLCSFAGRKYNKNGDLVNWWSESSNEAFEKKSQCFIKQYSNFEAYAKKVSAFDADHKSQTVSFLSWNVTVFEKNMNH